MNDSDTQLLWQPYKHTQINLVQLDINNYYNFKPEMQLIEIRKPNELSKLKFENILKLQ